MGRLRNIIHERNERKRWRNNNSHNKTSMGNLFDSKLVSVGRMSYGELNIINHSTKYHLIIGNFCSIGPDTLFVVCGDHPTDGITTYPMKVRYGGEKFEALSKGDIVVKDDVWIGARVTIMSGIIIGQGAVICAGAVVTKDVPPYAIVGGVPANIIKMRFDNNIINKLLKVNYNEFSDEFILEHLDEFYNTVSVDNIEWLPYKKEGGECW